MSTRGCVAVRREDGGWDGTYSQRDSYPTGLGREVFALMRAIPRDARQTAALTVMSCESWQAYYQGLAGSPAPVTRDDVDPLTIEWVYVIDPFRHEIEVLTSVPDGKRYTSMGTFPIDAPFDADAVEQRAAVAMDGTGRA